MLNMLLGNICADNCCLSGGVHVCIYCQRYANIIIAERECHPVVIYGMNVLKTEMFSIPLTTLALFSRFWMQNSRGKSEGVRQPGVEPGSTAWKATMLTATPLTPT